MVSGADKLLWCENASEDMHINSYETIAQRRAKTLFHRCIPFDEGAIVENGRQVFPSLAQNTFEIMGLQS